MGRRKRNASLEVLFTMIDCISRSKYAEYCVLLGGTAFITRLCSVFDKGKLRKTFDIDLDVYSVAIQNNFVQDVESILNVNTCGFTFKLSGVKSRVDSNNLTFKVYDIYGDEVCEVYIDLSTVDLNTIKFSYEPKIGMNVYDLQTMVVDKISVFYSQSIFRRIKDLYDLTLLSQVCHYSSSELIYLMDKRSCNFYSNAEFVFTPENYIYAEKAYKALLECNEGVDIELLPVMVDVCSRFALPVLKRQRGLTWDSNSMCWR